MRTLIRWQQRRELDILRHQMEQMLQDSTPTHRINESLKSFQASATYTPVTDLTSTETALVLRTEVPGAKAKDLDVRVTREAVVISGDRYSEQKSETDSRGRSEFHYSQFRRVIPLPVPVQHQQVKANFENGILTLELPKVTAEKPQVVKVNLEAVQPSKEETSDADRADTWIETANRDEAGIQAFDALSLEEDLWAATA